MNYLAQGVLNLVFSVEVDGKNEEEARLKAEMLANSMIEEVIVLTSKLIPIKLKVHNNNGEVDDVLELEDKKENHQTTAIA